MKGGIEASLVKVIGLFVLLTELSSTALLQTTRDVCAGMVETFCTVRFAGMDLDRSQESC